MAVTSVINEHGQRVPVPWNWHDILPDWFDGKQIIPTAHVHNFKSPDPPQLWIERIGGGYGDVIHLLSAIEDKIFEFKEQYGPQSRIILSFPSVHHFMLEQLKQYGVEVVSSENLDEHFGKTFNFLTHAIVNSREHINLLCPCDDHEVGTKFKPFKSRVEIFHEACEVNRPVRPPILRFKERGENPFPKKQKVVCICLRSIDRFKDWHFDGWLEVIKVLQKKGYFVYTSDLEFSFEGVPAIVKKSMPEVTRYLAWTDAIIGPDTGPIFLAASQGVTTIGLFGKTSGYLLLEKHYINGHAVQVIRPDLCKRPCYHSKEHRGFYCDQYGFSGAATGCMNDITVEMVVSMFEGLEKYGQIGNTRWDKEEFQKYVPDYYRF